MQYTANLSLRLPSDADYFDVQDINYNTQVIDNALQDLDNYYTKTEVDSLIGAVNSLSINVVEELPTGEDIATDTIYLKAITPGSTNNIYEEYIYVSNAWEMIGTTEVDLSQYARTEDIPTNTSDLTNDSDFVSDANYVHTDNNYDDSAASAVASITNKINNNLNDLDDTHKVSGIAKLTKAEYDALETKDANGLYFITDNNIEIDLSNYVTKEEFTNNSGSKFEIVDELPTGDDIDPNTIYLVKSDIIGGNQHIDLQVVTSLPATGAANTLYLIANSEDAEDTTIPHFDKYLYINDHYESLGLTRTQTIDLINSNSNKVYASTAAPTSTDGKNGDIWIVYEN